MTLPVRIDRCVCQRMTFSSLLLLAGERQWSLGQLVRETGCGDQCGMCLPYLRRMLASGDTVFHQPLEDVA
ncbi:MAG TPA: hypothetical protein VLL51_06370 [Gemmatimonadales bacterium]|nr:hypothetical protein [Gemmatimonadales bacterium]